MDYVVRPPMLSMCCNDPNFLGEVILSTCMIDIRRTVFRVLFAHFDESMASVGGYEP